MRTQARRLLRPAAGVAARPLSYQVSGSLALEAGGKPAAPGSGQVALTALAAPILRADLSGTSKPVSGSEGAFVVTAVGSGVSGLAEGDYVAPASSGFGTFRTYATAKEAEVIKVSSDLPPAYAAMLSAPACAAKLLEGVGAGDVVISTQAEKPVGQCLAQFAKAKGITLVNAVTADAANEEDSLKLLSELGGAEQLTVLDSFLGTPAFNEMVAELGPVKLALDATGCGRPVARLIQSLSAGGKLVSYDYGAVPKVDVAALLAHEGSAYADAIKSIASGKSIDMTTFSYQAWFDGIGKAEKEGLYAEMAGAFLDGTLDLWVEEHPLHDYDFAAMRASDPYYVRQIVLNKMDETPEDLAAAVKAAL